MDDESRVQYEGFRPGMYVRLEIPSIPCEFVTNFDPHYPVLVGALGASEGNIGYLQVSINHKFLIKSLRSLSFLPLVMNLSRLQTSNIHDIKSNFWVPSFTFLLFIC